MVPDINQQEVEALKQKLNRNNFVSVAELKKELKFLDEPGKPSAVVNSKEFDIAK